MNVDYDSLSQSACVDGTILNIDKAGCEMFYWGHIDDGEYLKMRCTHSNDKNFWTESSFYVTHIGQAPKDDTWMMFCMDVTSYVYVKPPEQE